MNGVKGLFYKELRLKRKNIVISMIEWLLFFILFVSICLSMDYGNLKNSENFSDEIVLAFPYVLAAVAMLSLINNCDTVYSDSKYHWDRFEYTLPVPTENIALVKIIFLVGMTVLSLALSIFSAGIIFSLSHRNFDFDTVKNIVIMAMFIFTVSVISTALMLKYKDPQAVSVRIFAGIIAVVIIITVLNWEKFYELLLVSEEGELIAFTESLFDIGLKKIFDILFMLSLPIYAAIIIGGYFLFKKQLMRREK